MDAPLDPDSISALHIPSTVETFSDYDAYLKQVYCGHVGFEFAHLDDPKEREWLTRRCVRPHFHAFA
jgi:2-oxoglutarate dehydrogenase complex dehydrogenase (E1) component-like enzyme